MPVAWLTPAMSWKSISTSSPTLTMSESFGPVAPAACAARVAVDPPLAMMSVFGSTLKIQS